MFSDTQIGVIHACAMECRRQQSGEMSVVGLVEAYEFALAQIWASEITEEDIFTLGELIEPEKNFRGYRIGPAVFNQGSEAVKPEHIKRQMELLLENQEDAGTMGFLHRLMEIHPFADGNGRLAFVLYNAVFSDTPEYPTVVPKMVFT